MDVRNNIFANTNGGYAVYITSGAVTLGYITTMDYNDIFSTGTNIGYYNTAAVVNNLNTWKSTTGKDANSISVNPAFISSTDLHISEMALNGSCMQLPEVPDDIDSQLRNNPTDMGADEFTPSTMVLDSITVTHPVLASVATGSANNVILRIAVHTSNSLNPLSLEGITFNTNGSSNPLNDIENAKLWSSGNVNNFANATQIGNTYNNPNNLFQINTGTGLPVTLNTGINYFWLTYNINSSATNLNVVDAEVVDVNINGNNYQPVNGAPNGTRTIRTPLSGIYQIGTGGDYSTLSAFFADVNQLGLMGNVTAKIISDITEIKRIEQIKKDFVINVSHELKTPLTAIKGFIETLEEEVTNEEHLHYIQIVRRHTDRLITIVKDLLLLTELEDEAYTNKLIISNVDLSALIENIKRLFEQKLKEKNLYFKINIEQNVPKIQVDAFRLEQVFVNLFNNAIKFTDFGGIEIHIERFEENVRIHFWDTGAGVPKEDQDRIFERFYISEKSRSRKFGGTGIGLSIVKHIILLHNGSICLDKEYKNGAKFEIILPIHYSYK